MSGIRRISLIGLGAIGATYKVYQEIPEAVPGLQDIHAAGRFGMQKD